MFQIHRFQRIFHFLRQELIICSYVSCDRIRLSFVAIQSIVKLSHNWNCYQFVIVHKSQVTFDRAATYQSQLKSIEGHSDCIQTVFDRCDCIVEIQLLVDFNLHPICLRSSNIDCYLTVHCVVFNFKNVYKKYCEITKN